MKSNCRLQCVGNNDTQVKACKHNPVLGAPRSYTFLESSSIPSPPPKPRLADTHNAIIRDPLHLRLTNFTSQASGRILTRDSPRHRFDWYQRSEAYLPPAQIDCTRSSDPGRTTCKAGCAVGSRRRAAEVGFKQKDSTDISWAVKGRHGHTAGRRTCASFHDRSWPRKVS